ncbi:unnamed protein product [Owenia fusiformis]|uniref:Polyketide synthase n=1 Tax=Owenia fusiformis TaxID=6347 RepID=A0A8S4Q0H9_OWEFU|nr:unnamed protein product [Owenia fusiformis]
MPTSVRVVANMDLTKAVAIVGVSCNFPGGEGVDKFWETLVESKNHLRVIPEERFNINAFYDTNRDAQGKTYTKHAAFLDSVFDFDNRLFNINEVEASRSDPQHRITLECVFKAFEDGGFPLMEMDGSNTGVYIGSMNDDYKTVLAESFDADNYMATGSAKSILANRVSYTFNLAGPSMAVDTACSSSMVAIHLGRQAILAGECNMAVCGGTNVILNPYMFVNLAKARMSSEKGQCHAFSEEADGYIRGEGCGIVLLKSVEQALRDNDKIWGYIGTGVNSDGHMATPMTAPSMERQQQLMEQVLDTTDVNPKDIDYVEAHGTGTPAGDPIEAKSVGLSIATKRPKEAGPCLVGSVKTNIGHTESAAGTAGLIKILLMMQHNQIAPSIIFNRQNPKIDFTALNMRLPTEIEVWSKHNDKPRLASVNCYGFGGTNSFAVVQQHIQYDTFAAPNHQKTIVVLSANNAWSLKESIKDLLAGLDADGVKLENLAYTSTARRTHYDKRIAIVGADKEEIKKGLEIQLDNIDTKQKRQEKLRTIFVFCGMGTHWLSMGIEMLTNHVNSVFTQTLTSVDEQISKSERWSLIDKLKTKSDLADPSIGQPAIFAIQVSLARQWIEWGIKPSCIVGHSVGEVAACCIAGKLSLEAATNVIVARGKCVQEANGGSMLVVSNYDYTSIKEVAAKFNTEIAAINSPTSCTLSGSKENISALKSHLNNVKQDNGINIFLRELDVSVAYHSKFMDPILDKLKNQLNLIDLAPAPSDHPRCNLISTVSGKAASENDYTTPGYWLRNVRQTVLFRDAMDAVLDVSDYNVILEIGPRPALRTNIKDITGKSSHIILPSFKPNEEWSCLLTSLGRLYELGFGINWKKVHPVQCTPIPFPRYHFKRNYLKYYPEEADVRYRTGENGTIGNLQAHPFITGGMNEGHFVCSVKRDTMPFVFDHKSSNRILVPGATYVELGMSCSVMCDRRLAVSERISTSVRFVSPCTLDGDVATRKLDICITSKKGNNMEFTVSSEKSTHAIGSTTFHDSYTGETDIDVKQIGARCPNEYDASAMYEQLEKFKFTYGPSLQGIQNYKTNGKEWLLKFSTPEPIVNEKDRMLIHPSVLDNILQALVLVPQDGTVAFPFEIGKLTVRKPIPSDALIYIRSESTKKDRVVCHAALLTETGEVIVECKNTVLKLLTGEKFSYQPDVSYSIQWERVPDRSHSENIANSKKCLILEDATGLMKKLRPFINAESTFIAPPAVDSYNDFIRSERSLENILKCHTNNLTQYDLVIFAWGVPEVKYNNVKARTDQVETPILFACSALRQLVQCLYKTSSDTPLYVVTKNSQMYQNDDEPIDLCGASILAMTRALGRERVFQHLFQIDFSTGSSLEIESFVRYLYKPPDQSELAYRGDDVYTNQIKPYLGRPDDHRLPISDINKANAVLVSTDPTKIANPSLLIKNHDNPTTISKSECLVHIESFRVCRNGLFRPDVNDDLNVNVSEPWMTTSHKNSFSVSSIDFIGHVKKPKGDQHERVLVCYPHVVQRTMVIPRKCVIPLNNVPFITNSLCLSLYVISWKIIKHLNTKQLKTKKSSKIYISGFEQHQDLDHILRSLLKASNIYIVRAIEEASHVIILTDGQLPMAEIKNIQKAKSLKQVIIVETINGSKSSNIVCQSLGHKTEIFVLQTLLVLSPYTLQKNLSKATEWIKSLKPSENQLPVYILQSPTDFDSVDDNDTHGGGICVCNLMERTENKLLGQSRGYSNTKWEKSSQRIYQSQDSFNEERQPVSRLRKARSMQQLKRTRDANHQEFDNRVSQCFQIYVGQDDLFRADAAYIHVGGTSGLGAELMKHMAKKGAGYQISLSRSAGKKTEDMEKIERDFGVKIITLSADATKLETLENAVQEFHKLHPGIPIKGIFNGAVVLNDGPLSTMDEAKFQGPTKPKIQGSWNLHLLSFGMDLDFFVMHSSMASTFGNPGQSNYCAGNGFQDALSLYRRYYGYPSLTINWGALDLGILKTNVQAQRVLEKDGINVLDAECIVECFDYALTANPEQIAFVNANWKAMFKSRLIMLANIGNRFIDLMKTHSPEQYEVFSKGARAQVERDSENDVTTELTGGVRAKLKKLLAKLVMTDEDEMNDTTSIVEYGIDSIVVVTLQSDISATFGVDIPVVDLLSDTTTISHLVNKLGGDSEEGDVVSEIKVHHKTPSADDQKQFSDENTDVSSSIATSDSGSVVHESMEVLFSDDRPVLAYKNKKHHSNGSSLDSSEASDSGVSVDEPVMIPFRNGNGRPAVAYNNNHMAKNLDRLDGDLAILEQGSVFNKHSRHGLKRKKQVTVMTDSESYAITWTSGKSVGQVSMSELISVRCRTGKGIHLLDLETTRRTITFFTTSRDKVNKWYKGLNRLLEIKTDECEHWHMGSQCLYW